MENYKELIMLLLLSHTLADFYFQTESIAKNKEKSFKYIVFHSLIYGIVNLLTIKFIFNEFENIYLWIIVISHFVIDSLKFLLKKNNYIKKHESCIFIIDQIAHFTVLIILSCMIANSKQLYNYRSILINISNIMGFSVQTIIAVILQILLIHKPINIFIVHMMKSYKPVEKKSKNTIKTGRMIGTIERMIMLFFLSIQQYSSVGLVLTAKSIARYDKISKDQQFAEYYLLGTLLSTLCVLIISLI